MSGALPAVLLVDDVEANLVALRGVLESLECELVSVSSGDAALKLLLEREFVLILLDAQMPGMDGFEVARYARSNQATRDVPIVFLTALAATEQNLLRGYGQGAIDFLSKPVNATIVRSKVQVFLNLHAARRELLVAQARALELQAEARLAESRRTLLEELTRRNADLERANVDLEQFAYVASHDLQDPLGMLRTYLDLLHARHADALRDEAVSYLRFAIDGAERLQVLVDALQSYAGVHDESPRTDVDMNQVVDAAVSQVRAALGVASGEIKRGDLPVVRGSAAQLSQLVQNLISNAVTFRSAAPLRVDVGVELGKSEWTFTVSDNGVGMEEGLHERAFQLFQRGHTAQHRPGAGVGLAVVRRVVYHHGGRIWLESRREGGLSVFFTLPRQQER